MTMLRSSAVAALEPCGVTMLLDASRGGDEEAWSQLVRQVYGDLQRLAHRQRREHAVPVTLGVSDGTFTEAVGGNLTAGQAVLIGLESGSTTPATSPTPGFRL